LPSPNPNTISELVELETIYLTAPVGLCLMDTELKWVRINQHLADMHGFPVSAHIGRHISELLPDIAPFIVPVYEQVIQTGQPAIDLEVSGELKGEPRDYISNYFPLVQDGKIIGVNTVVMDITEIKSLREELLSTTAGEQQRIGQELHDTVGQELTGLAFLARGLAQSLVSDSSADADLATRVAEGIDRALASIRILSRGLVPVEVDPDGLRAALAELAHRTSSVGEADCTFDGEESIILDNFQTATHLYRIAQEAVTNALKHGNPKQVRIELFTEDGVLNLVITDDGAGMPGEDRFEGVGLRNMTHRARLLGGKLEISAINPQGTRVRCILPGRGGE